MLLIFGSRVYETLVVLVSFVCPHCGVDAQQRVIKLANRFTFFFVPLFAVSTKYVVECGNCAVTTALTRQQAEHSVEWAASRR
jgi:hypothetical protein